MAESRDNPEQQVSKEDFDKRINSLRNELLGDLQKLKVVCGDRDQKERDIPLDKPRSGSLCDDIRQDVAELKKGTARRSTTEKILFALILIAVALAGMYYPTVFNSELRRQIAELLTGQGDSAGPELAQAGTTRYREEKYTVLRPVRETSLREEKYTVRRPVRETSYREEKYTERRPVHETSYREEKYTVRRPVRETAYRDERVTVRKPVYSTEYRNHEVTVQEPVTNVVTQQYCDPLTGQLAWTDVPVTTFVPRTIVQRTPIQTVRYVDAVEVRKVPVETVRYVEEEKTRKVPVETVRYVEEEKTRKVPVETVRYVEEEKTRKVPVETVRYVEEERTRLKPETVVEP